MKHEKQFYAINGASDFVLNVCKLGLCLNLFPERKLRVLGKPTMFIEFLPKRIINIASRDKII